MNRIIDAYIELPDDPQTMSAFVGDDAFSPFELMLAALKVTPDIRYVLVPFAGSREEIPCKDERIRVIPPQSIPDIRGRTVGKSLRAWSHAGSVYGPLMTTEFCTYGNPSRVLASLPRPLPEYVLTLTGNHAFITHEMIGNIIKAGEDTAWIQGVYMADGPRGLVPVLWDRVSLQQMRDGNALAQAIYWNAQRFWGQTFAHVPTEVVQCRRSFTLETNRGRAFCGAVARRLNLKRGAPPPSLLDVVRAGVAEHGAWAGQVPMDVEVEVTTERDFDPRYLPKLSRPAATMPIELFSKIMRDLEPHKDSTTLTLGGFGDPLNHPHLLELVRIAKPCVRAVNVRTFGTRLTEEAFINLVREEVDVINVRFGHWGKEQYRDMNGVDGFDEISERIMGFRKKQMDQGTRLPLIVPEVVKGAAGDKTLIDFRDGWWKLHAWPVVTSYNTFAGAVEPQQAVSLYPGVRRPCFKITEQMLIHADGRVPLCLQDFDCRHEVGNVNTHSIGEIWTGPRLSDMRQAHVEGAWDRHHAPCGKCNEWFRLS